MSAAPVAAAIAPYIDLRQPSLWVSAASVCFNPTFWNIVARNEYHNKTITRVLGGRRYLGCYLLGATIFSLGILRDALYDRALAEQPTLPVLDQPGVRAAAAALFTTGSVLVASSMWALGVTGTYLGDYFLILMPAMVTGFPFNVCNDPMYVGSTLCFTATALWYAKPAGLALTLLVAVVYTIALRFETPFTSYIYAQAAKEKRAQTAAQSASTATAAAAADGTSTAVAI